MARSRGGAMGLVVALVIVSLFFVTALVFVILLFSEREKHEMDRDAAIQRLKHYVFDSEVNEDWVRSYVNESAKKPRKSGMLKLYEETMFYKELIGGTKTGTRAEVMNEIRTAGINDPKSTPLLRVIRDLQDKAEVVKTATDDKQKTIERLNEDIKSKTSQLQEEALKSRQAIEIEQARIRELSQEKSEIEARYDKLIATQKEDVKSVQDTNRREVGKLRGTIAQLKTEIGSLERALQEKGDYIDNLKLRNVETIPDGIVESTVKNKRLFINLTRADRVILGMTFEVYDKETGIVPDPTGKLRGKATIEVVTITDTQSQCLVIRDSPARPIRPGDIIGNVVYDPNMTFKFYIWGYFDMDNIGKAKKDDMKRVALEVEKWGGKAFIPKNNLVDDKTELKRQELKNILSGGITELADGTLNDSVDLIKARLQNFQKSLTQGINKDLPWRFLKPDYDFVIIGEEPVVPAEPDELTADPVERKQWETLNRDYQMHKAIEAEARELGITVLNQNRFLQLIGYYRR